MKTDKDIRWHYTQGAETFAVDGGGRIGRYALSREHCHGWLVTPSDSWRVTGAVRCNNFGAIVEGVPFPDCMAIKDWRHKNGTARWRICDFDHGSHRIQGGAILSIWSVTP